MRGPLTGAFQMPVWTVLPCQVTSRGEPTLTESKRPITFLSDGDHRTFGPEQKARPAATSISSEKQWWNKLDQCDQDDCKQCRDREHSAHSRSSPCARMPGSVAFGVGLHGGCPDADQASAATSIIASAKAFGASCGRLCPTPPLIVRWEYLPENILAYAEGSGCGAPFASPSMVIVGTLMTGLCASRFSKSSYFASPSARPSRHR